MAGAVTFSLAHTTLMAVSRSALFPLLSLGPYDYGTMVYRYPMEFSNDVIVYAAAVGFVYLWKRTRAEQRLAIEAARLSAELLEARLENLRLQLNPHFLFNSLHAISSVMCGDPR